MPENCEVKIDKDRQGVVVKTCRTCGARHIEMSVDPGRIFGKGT